MAIAHARPIFALPGLRSAHHRPAAGEARPRRRRAGRRAFGPSSTLGLALALLFVCGLAAPFGALAQDVNTDEMRSLDERVQSIKSDVLEIAAELTQLEEKLLYPSSTQVAVFVSMAKGYDGDLDSVEIRIDGEAVAHHIYTYKEVDALGKGGVQRVYTGNLSTGDHQLVVSVKAALQGGREVVEQRTFTISKEATPKLVDLHLAGGDGGGMKIEVGDG